MANELERKVIVNLKNALAFLCSRRSLPMLKGTLAYLLLLVLIFLRKFDDISEYPLAFSNAMIVVLANNVGRSVGACIQATGLSVIGVSLGAVGFVTLAKLSPWPVAQAFLFALIVYVMALLKAQGRRWFICTILCVLNSFNGIYTSAMLGDTFSPTYFKGYLVSYLWGAAIVLGVNILVLPHSSEKELRQTLVTSLEHVGTFAHLLAKGYTLEISEEELAVRERLSQTIRADFGFLSQKIQETTIEINYSRFSMKSYQSFVSRTRALQQALITAHSSLVGVSSQDYDLFKERFLPSTLIAFNNLRRAIDLTIRDIGNELGCVPMVIPATQETYLNYMEAEAQIPREGLESQLTLVSERLAAEVDERSVPPTMRDGTQDEAFPSPTSATTIPGAPDGKEKMVSSPRREPGILRLRREFDAYSVAQHDMLQETLVSGNLQGANDGKLYMYNPRASINDMYGGDTVDGDADEGDVSTPKLPLGDLEKKNMTGEELEVTQGILSSGNSLIRVWGFLFALEQFVSELELLSESVKPEGIHLRKRLHMHLFEALHRPNGHPSEKGRDLPLQEALALLENSPYTLVRRTIWQHLEQYAHILQSPSSIFAAKTSAAASVYGVLVYASVPRPWFINYTMTSGMLTIVVALAPTLGQSMMTFVLQIAGSGSGYLWGMIVLEMFRNVGGFRFNPYGVACMVLPFIVIMQYILHNVPKYFVVAILALNGCGVVITLEWVSVEFLHRENYDSPPLRAGKALASLAIALSVVAIFQLFILRNPARRTLRKQVASLTFETLSYSVLLQAFGRSVLSSEPRYRPSASALSRVERELRHRELKLQSKIIETMPLLSFAAAEPQFTKPFRGDIFSSCIKSNQIILDRLREARAALGTQQFGEFILTHFIGALAPYRARNTRTTKAQLYMVASSLQSKAPLPHDTPIRVVTDRDRADFIHDALVLSAQFSKTEEGNKSVRSREFMRYISYLLGWLALYKPLRDMEKASKELLGELETKLL